MGRPVTDLIIVKGEGKITILARQNFIVLITHVLKSYRFISLLMPLHP